ncbi:hypothetical protein T229_11605 [Tannerella sp. oral taxon BU063 isolate Cell 5]|uniref:BACON domain-containing protein n=1 Tax=Tannerella sp. oral taxon BU063 isolate Cell 5 TaxID=1410950 RepID=W2C9K9_9BACT|nr:hypothetical protein T229_11605 [Tannerella sp. oral taxon BU063 isolate Cell 5]
MLLALLLILAGLAGAIAPQTAAAYENYNIWIGGKWITSENYTDISASGGFPAVQSGTVTFDPDSYTLTLNNATIEGDIYSMDVSKSYTIVLQGDNTIKNHMRPINFRSSLRITGGGLLKIEPNNLAIYVEGDLTIDGCYIETSRYIEVRGRLEIIKGQVVVANDKAKDFAYKVRGGITLSNSTINAPKGGQVKQIKTLDGMIYTVVNESGEIAPSVGIGPGTHRPDKIVYTLEPKELDVDANRNDVSFTLSCNVPYRITGADKPDWLNVTGSSGDYEAIQKMTIVVKKNTGGKREGVITFKTTEGEVKLKVTQAAAGTKPEAKFTLEPKELDAGPIRNDYEVTLSCNIPYHINKFDKPEWLSVNGNSGGLEAIQKMTIAVKANTGGKREGTITFKTTAGDITLKVTQEGTGTKPEAKFTLEPKELKVEAKGGMKEVTLSCNKEFLINQLEVPDWISNYTYYSTAAKSNEIKLFISQNTGAERTADVVFKTDLGDVTLKVTQAGGAKPEPKPEVKFTLEPKELKVETDGGKKEVKLSCNQAFELNKVTVPSWMERVPSSATSDEKSRVCAFNIQKNTGAERMGEIIFHTDKGDVTLKVTQAGKKEKPEPTLTLSPDMLTFPTGGGKQTVNVKSDYGWDTKASAASASWMKLTTDVKTGKIVVEVTPNTSTKKRGATIGVVSSRRRIGHRTPITRHILVTQEAAKAVEPPVAATGISLNPAAMTMGSGGGTVGFNVYAGKGWTISGSPEWMHPDATRGSGTRLVIVRFDRNESGAERTGKLTVKSDDGKAERTFTLTQRAGQRKPTPSPGSTPSEEYDYDLALNPEEITVGPSDGAGSSISVATSRLWAGSTTEEWIRLESAVGRGNGSFTFTVAANPSKEMRHGTITVRTQQGMDELKVAIHQQGNDGSIVPPAEVKVSNVTLDPATLTVNGDLSTALISAIVSPDNARNKGLLWMSSNASVATVQVFTPKQSAALPQLRFAPDADDYALVTIVGKGKATIAATTSDGSGIVARCEVNVLSTVANTVPYAPQAKVYTVGPTLYLSLPTPEAVQVYTLAGTLYRTWQAPAGDTSVTLPVGTYIIKVGPLTEKVVVR